jgi:hypothetical protein
MSNSATPSTKWRESARETPSQAQAEPVDPAAVLELPTELRAAPAPVGDALPAELDVGLQCAARFAGPTGGGFGTLVRLMGEGLTLLCHGPPPVGARLRLRVELDDDEIVEMDVQVIMVRPDPGAGPARVTARWSKLPGETAGALMGFLRRRAEAEASRPVLRVAVRERPPMPTITREPRDPTGAVTELGSAPRRGWIATLRQRARGLRPDIVGPARAPFRGQVELLPDGHNLVVRWAAEEDWRCDWVEHLSQGLLPLPAGLSGPGRRRVQLRLPDGGLREALAAPARGLPGLLRLSSPWADESASSRTG